MNGLLIYRVNDGGVHQALIKCRLNTNTDEGEVREGQKHREREGKHMNKEKREAEETVSPLHVCSH